MLKTREQWLLEAVPHLSQHLKATAKLDVPQVRVSCGWPSRGGTSKKKRVLGECWLSEAAKDNVSQIFVSPYLRDPIEVLGVLLHELIHAALPEAKHGPVFKKAARGALLEGPATATKVSPELRPALDKLAGELGEYDNSSLDALAKSVDGKKRQSTRMLKAYCEKNAVHVEDYVVRLTKKQTDIGMPCCPCGKEMVLEEKEEDDNGRD